MSVINCLILELFNFPNFLNNWVPINFQTIPHLHYLLRNNTIFDSNEQFNILERVFRLDFIILLSFDPLLKLHWILSLLSNISFTTLFCSLHYFSASNINLSFASGLRIRKYRLLRRKFELCHSEWR